MKKIALLALAASLAFSPAFAGNTNFLTERNAAITFPISPPNRATGGPGAIDNMTIGATTPRPGTFSNIINTDSTPIQQGAPAAQDTAATLTATQISAGIITSNPAGAINLQLPLATAMDTFFSSSAANDSVDFFVISIAGGTNLPTITTNTGWTLVGAMTFTAVAGNAGHFRARKTATGAWTLYRLS